MSAAIPAEAPAATRPELIKAVPVRRTGQWISAAVVVAILAALVWSVATNENLQWSVVGDYLFDSSILQGRDHHHQAHRAGHGDRRRARASCWPS